MSDENQGNLAGVAQSLITTPPPSSDATAGTVVTSNGTRVTLGEQGRTNQTLLSTTKGTNPRTK